MLKYVAVFIVLVTMAVSAQAQKGQFLTVDEYRQQQFSEAVRWQTLWVNKELRSKISGILGRQFAGLRIRYWGESGRTAWIFEEIGKELPITVGIAVGQRGIEDVTVLEYRESRGGEVRYPFFTDQFKNVSLNGESSNDLDVHIDGITGATLSVRALTRIARLALFCHSVTPFAKAGAQ